jgi:hypothetical protein
MGDLLTQAFSLGFARSPLWGSPAHTSKLSLTGFWSAAAPSLGYGAASYPYGLVP